MVLLIFLCCYLSSIQTILFDFDRVITSGDTTSTVSGTVYFNSNGRSVVEVQSPIIQYMLFEKNTWKVYYPEKQEAYEFKSERPFQIPIVEILSSSLKENFGLVKDGYDLVDFKAKNDTIISWWNSKSIMINYQIKLLQLKEKFIGFELIQQDTIRVKTHFIEHFQYGNKYIPIEISSEIFPGMSNSGISISELIYIKNLKFNAEFPDRINKFKIPENLNLQKMNFNKP